MNTKLLLATVAGAIVSFFLGWIVFGMLLMDFYQSNTTLYPGLMNEMPNMVYLVIGQLAMAFFMAFVFQRWARFFSFAKGFTGGLFIGFFFTLVIDAYFISGMNLFSLKLMVIDVVINTVLIGIIGGIIGLILGTGKKEA
jgi:hypothetical protein